MYFGTPRDVEFGIKNNEIYLLQSRPITNLKNYNEWESMHENDSAFPTEHPLFSRANIGEICPGALSYLGKDCFNLLLGNGGSVNIFLNNHDLIISLLVLFN